MKFFSVDPATVSLLTEMTKQTDHPKIFITPLLLFIVLLVLAFYLEHKLGLGYPKAPLFFRLPISLTLVLYSGYLAIHSIVVLKRGRNPIDPRKPARSLVITGPFRFSRNPMYLSLLICFLSLAVWFYSMWLFSCASLLWLILDIAAVTPEERYLEDRFGDAYKKYKSNVSRWI